MPQIPLPAGFTGLEDFPKLRENLINLFNPDNKIISTPGINAFGGASGVTRGGNIFQDEPYYIAGNRLERIEPDGSTTDFGLVEGTGIAYTAVSFTQIAIANGPAYVKTNTGNVSRIPNFDAIDVDSINGIAVWIPSDGSPAQYSDVNAFQTLAGFFDAEALPDKNTGVINVKNDLYIGGQDSIEMFNATGVANAPFRRNEAAAINIGYVSGKTLYGETWAFLGRIRNGAYGFHVVTGGAAPDLANDAISEIINTEYTESELKSCIGQRIKWKGYEILVFTLPRHTCCYLNERWFFMESGIAGASVDNRWRGQFPLFAYNGYLVGDSQSGNIGKLADTSQEYGEAIEREMLTFVRATQGSYFNIDSVSLNGLVGTGVESDTIGLAMSENGQTFGWEIFQSLGALGDYNLRVEWAGIPGGLGDYQDFAGMRFRCTRNVELGIDALQFNGQQ